MDDKLEFMGESAEGASPQHPTKNLFENLLASLGANLPTAKFARFLELPKPL